MFRASAPFSASSTQLPSRLNQSAMIERQSGSSSTTNIVASFRCIFRLLNQRKKKGKASVVFNFGHLEFSSVFHDNRFRQAQSQASAFAHRLGRKKWLHDSRFELGRYAVPAINHCENNRLLRFVTSSRIHFSPSQSTTASNAFCSRFSSTWAICTSRQETPSSGSNTGVSSRTECTLNRSLHNSRACSTISATKAR